MCKKILIEPIALEEGPLVRSEAIEDHIALHLITVSELLI